MMRLISLDLPESAVVDSAQRLIRFCALQLVAFVEKKKTFTPEWIMQSSAASKSYRNLSARHMGYP